MDANVKLASFTSRLIRFNPRARDGREWLASRRAIAAGVSIHAPVMDAK